MKDQQKIQKKSIELAEDLQYAIEKTTKSSEKAEQSKYELLANDPLSKNVLLLIFDRAFRSANATKVVSNLSHILRAHGIPKFFKGLEKVLINIFLLLGNKVPSVSLFFIKQKIRQDTSNVILSARHLRYLVYLRRKKKLSNNLNQLGEAVLGDKEALKHLDDYCELLDRPYVDYISVKVSSIFSEIHPLGFDRSKEIVKQRLAVLFKKAKSAPLFNKSRFKHKFVNLDMEEYKDLELTYQAFTEILSEDRFQNLTAGIVLQAYLPDSYQKQQALIEWARLRVEKGGASIKMRLVKGANLAMESVTYNMMGLPSPVFESKVLTDANFKRMLDFGLRPNSAKYVRLGVASHNLFDLAYATVLAEYYNTSEYLTFEVLDGMAEPLIRVLADRKKDLIIYSPFTDQKNFLNSIAYLVRRLDENTAAENFLRYSFSMQLGSQSWEYLKNQFIEAQSLKLNLSSEPIIKQNRASEGYEVKDNFNDFANESETDFNLPANIEWAKSIKEKFDKDPTHKVEDVALQVGARVVTNTESTLFFDHNQPEAVPLYKLGLASLEHIDEMLDIAAKSSGSWDSFSLAERAKVLSKVAALLRQNRGNLIGLMAQITGKVFLESDMEITEAIDFLEYYPYSLNILSKQTSADFNKKGVVLVISPWNFPLAIPLGGVAAALASGNSVILKPAPEAAVVSNKFAEYFWAAGVPKEVFQVLNCKEGAQLDYLVRHPLIEQIIFTGSTETAQKILQNKPGVKLSAETGGKNATIVTQMADVDLAVKNIIRSAFSNGGQKCSSTSLLILEKPLYHSKAFLEKLVDCASSYLARSPWDLFGYFGPLISKPSGKLLKGIMHNEPGEEWLLEPKIDIQNNRLVSPGIKIGVTRGSFMHQTELFGPVLAVMCSESLADAINIANDNEYGLTSGLESLDEDEQKYWLENIQAGNLYINRTTVGAIVMRQPFGGTKKSAFGSGFKAGGHNYAAQFANIVEKVPPKTDTMDIKFDGDFAVLNLLINYKSLFEDVLPSFFNYQTYFKNYFSKPKDYCKVLGQANIFRYKTGVKICIRVTARDSFENLLLAVLAGILCRCDLRVSFAPDFKQPQSSLLNKLLDEFYVGFAIETEDRFFINMTNFSRIRSLGPKSLSERAIEKAAFSYKPILDHVPYKHARLELPYYLQEQSISYDYHRYGNLGFKPADIE